MNQLKRFCKTFLKSKISSNALFFTIIISLVIALLCSSLIFIAYFHKVQVQQNQLKERLIRNANSAIQLLLASPKKNHQETFDLFGDVKDSVFMGLNVWGTYEIGHVKAFSHRDSISKSFIVGSVPDSLWKSSLYLVDQGLPVAFAGNTLVKGTAYLPAAGPISAAVDGKDFSRKKLVEGDIRKSSNKLPDLSAVHLEKMLDQVKSGIQIDILPLKALKTDSIVASFSQPTLKISGKGSVVSLSRITLKGNLIIASDTLIEVYSSANLENIILTAPKIVFKDDFKGSVQAFATDSLITGESSVFHYPSALVLLETDSIENSPKIIISKKSRVEGVIMVYTSFLDRSQAQLIISPEAEIIGQVYVDGLVNHEGLISGTLVCSKFRLSRPSGTYDNYLLDCTIDRTSLSSSFLGSSLFNTSRKNIAKWLD